MYHRDMVNPTRLGSTTRCWIDERGRLCVAGVPSHLMAPATRIAQVCENCCWAATISYVWARYGFHVSQASLVEELFGRLVDRPARTKEMLELLNADWIDETGRRFASRAYEVPLDFHVLKAELDAGRPVLVGVRGAPVGHAMLVTRFVWRERQIFYWDGTVRTEHVLVGVLVRDPSPGAGRRELTRLEWKRIDSVIRVRVFA